MSEDPSLELKMFDIPAGAKITHVTFWNPDEENPDEVACSDCGRRYVVTPEDDYYQRNSDGAMVCFDCLIKPINAKRIVELDAVGDVVSDVPNPEHRR